MDWRVTLVDLWWVGTAAAATVVFLYFLLIATRPLIGISFSLLVVAVGAACARFVD